MSIITRRSFASCLSIRQGILAPVAGLASRLVERLSSVCPFPVGIEEDACSLPFRLRSLSKAGLRLDTPVFFAPSAGVSRFPEACECRKLQESLLNKTHCLPLKALSCLPLGEGILSLSFGYCHTLCNPLSSFNVQFHTQSSSVIISLSSSSQNFLIV